ncbi:MAG: esterase family protein [Phycisphaerales bacterium]|nr:esterase family protein [Phycisphaerales bacterium]
MPTGTPAFLCPTALVAAAAFAEPVVSITLPKDLQPEPFTGRVYLVMSKGGMGTPREHMADWFNPPVILSLDVKDAAPGAPIDLSRPAFAFPQPMAELPAGVYTVQGVARRSKDHYAPGLGAGDLYSRAQKIAWPPQQPLSLTLDETVKERKFRESATIKHFSLRSTLLSDFHHRDVTLHAGVALPEGWSETSTETWPAVYFVTGFGGSHRDVAMFPRSGDARKVITIVPDATNYWGHSVFADSVNTGPWGRALTEELIPAVEKQFHGPLGAPDATADRAAARRYVTGISSGGWSSLWLPVAYPDTFAGAWSHSPDPVDFRAFQLVNLYEPGANMYTLPDGKPNPIARQGDTPILFYKSFVLMETALGPGGQIRSFEAVFSPRGTDGEPRPLFDRATGAVDPQTVEAWRPYDIALKLRTEWKQLSPRLVGKLHVYGGSADNFYLDSAVEKLAATLKELDPDNTIKAEVKIIPGMQHSIHFPAQTQMYKAAATTAPAVKQPADPSPAPAK